MVSSPWSTPEDTTTTQRPPPSVWSVTQFYSGDSWQSKIGVKKWVFYKRTIKVCVSCSWQCLWDWRGTPNGQCPCFSIVPDTKHEASRGPLKGTVSPQKALQGSVTEMVIAGWNWREKYFSDKGSLICSRKINYFYFTKKETEKIELGARPGLPNIKSIFP